MSALVPPSPPTYLQRRVERPHPFNTDGRQILVPTASMLTAAEKKRAPKRLVELFERFRERVAKAPPPFEWLSEATSGLEPVLECARFDDREYWNVRLSRPFGDSLGDGCFGCDADPAGSCPASVPRSLAWLRKTFGTIGLIAEQSGTAPFGRLLSDVAAKERAIGAANAEVLRAFPGFSSDDELYDRFAGLPAGAGAWVSLYEADGDWVFADVARNETVWVGSEWTGEEALRFAVPWTRAASFILWRVLDGEYVRPVDLRMLAAG